MKNNWAAIAGMMALTAGIGGTPVARHQDQPQVGAKERRKKRKVQKMARRKSR